MKKFMFSLSTLFEMKKTRKDELQREYTEAKAKLERAFSEKITLDQICADESRRYEAKVKKGVTAADMEAHAIYFKELCDKISAAANQVTCAQLEVNQKQGALVETFKEIKALEKLREKQYREYLAEEEKQGNKIREDILAFNITGKKAELTGTVS
ncbi:hypothetical protein SDC9_49956 [bioreactor metagenome]|uniref:Flagellar FliJ protein n=1 Tax=bioreactor metagenome TaxID=1076179 RepID=A0A644WJB3_9ZZZZ